MDLKDKVKIECVKKNIGINDLSFKLGMSRQNLYHHLKRNNEVVIEKIENILELPKGFFSK